MEREEPGREMGYRVGRQGQQPVGLCRDRGVGWRKRQAKRFCRDQIRLPAKGEQGKERRLWLDRGEGQGGCPRPLRTMGT